MKIRHSVSTLLLLVFLVSGSLRAADEKDASDAEANSPVSDSSMAITAQNDYIESIMESVDHITATRLIALLAEDGRDDLVFLDVRSYGEFAETEGVPGVELNIPRNFLEVEAYEALPDFNASIIVLSSKGIRGALAAHTLQEMGYGNVRNLLGGLEAWWEATAE